MLRLLLLAFSLGLASSATAAPTGLAPYHEPPWLITRGTSPTLAYALLPATATGTLYVRDDLRHSYTRIVLRRGAYCPGDPKDAAAMRRDKVCGSALLARVPRSLTQRSKLFYYAVIRDHHRSVKVGPQRVWVVRQFKSIRIGAEPFGQPTRPDAIVAQTKDVGLACCADPPGGDGPSGLDIGTDGSVWVLDRLSHRLLVFHAGTPTSPARSVRLPINLWVKDFALGRGGTIYLRTDDHLYALNPSGRIRWTAPAPSGIAISQLQMGPGGILYATQACGIDCAPFGGHIAWTPLTTRSGRFLPAATRAARSSPLEPLGDGVRLVSEISYSVARFALINPGDSVVRAWKVTSKTRLSGIAAAPTLVDGVPVVPLDVSNGRRWEKLIVRLDGSLRLRLADRPIIGEVNLFTPLRTTVEGDVYQLRTSMTGGASVARYSIR